MLTPYLLTVPNGLSVVKQDDTVFVLWKENAVAGFTQDREKGVLFDPLNGSGARVVTQIYGGRISFTLYINHYITAPEERVITYRITSRVREVGNYDPKKPVPDDDLPEPIRKRLGL